MPRGRTRRHYLPREELYSLYVDQLWSSYQCAEHFQCSPPTVLIALKAHNIPVRKVGNSARGKPRRYHLPTAEMVDLYVNGLVGVETLATRYGCSGPTITNRLREAGVTIRACNDTKRGAPSPLRHVIDEAVAVNIYVHVSSASISEIAKHLDCHPAAVARAIDSRGVPRKTPSQVYAGKRDGRANPNWRDDLTDEERLNRRDNAKSVKWRAQVYERDRFTCRACDDADGGNLNAHHIESYNSNRALRWEVSNGVTLCETCHLDFHKRFGYGNNTAAQLAEFLSGERTAV